ncbi:nucleoside-diphosphate kinase [Alkalibacterium olivapovliticus]|uniref:Nucleoside diphosphate kinase n=1 Tax=Alkalibacterium olivapovliticus TaxID=99907 RepID=A0A2T0VTN5_9LACT|nr:nucleoside-diphosphate kinase [Alkalibacterium olivapovliticus]MCC5895389.1 nucleoside-diphosphate kinase [Alkalibacterium sp.]PRY74478.1 nucleoside-diphosphate kinase [Alkalibacterium olivapovliticus]
MSQSVLVLIKPDAVRRRLTGLILSEFEKRELTIIDLKMMTSSRNRAEKHYESLLGKPFFDEVVSYLSSGPLVAVILEGDNCIEIVRDLNGSTDPRNADKCSIRGKYGISKTQNTVHASDSPQSAEREIALWFDGVTDGCQVS